MVQSASSSNNLGICSLDIIGHQHHSVGSFVRNRRQNQRQLGQKIARKRLLQNAQGGLPSTGSGNNGVLAHHRTGRGDLYLTGESSQYSNCCFLDGHDVVCATSVHGDLDVIRLPRYGGGDSTLAELAGKVQLSESYSVSARYKLKPLCNGQAFAVGSPSGTLSIFSTEHASTWCRNRLPSGWKRTVHQDSLTPANPADQQTTDSWAPFVTNQWQTDTMLERQTTTSFGSFSSYFPMSPESVLVQPVAGPEWSIKPHSDSLWDFRETPSSLLAALAKQDYQGCAKQIVVMDSRTHNNGAETIASISNTPTGRITSRSLPEGITAICFASEYSILSAHAKIHHAGPKVENSIRLWDLRKSDQPVQATTLVNPERNNKRGLYGSHFVSFLKPSTLTGRVMVTSSSHQNRSAVLHSWFDLGGFQMVSGPSGSSWSCIHQRNRNTSVFATNPDQDLIACYETSPGGDAIHLFDPSVPPEDDRTSNAPRAPILQNRPRVTTSRKRRVQHKPDRAKSSRRTKTTAVRLTSSSSSEDDEEEGSSNTANEPPKKGQQYRGVTCLGSYRPKLSDRYGLTTQLSCLSVNYSGTAIVGCSYDGDTFVWRGA